ncbi:MAG: hypothetical protein QM598_12215 [Protaetiibacter sp.]
MSTQMVTDGEPAPYVVERAPQPPRSKTLGRVAMLLGLGVFAGSLLAALLMGFAAAPYARSGPGGFGVNLRLDSGDPVEATLAVLAFVHVLLGTALGVWALTQGIVAIATARGRAFGVVAVVAAFLAPGLSLVVYMATAVANAQL